MKNLISLYSNLYKNRKLMLFTLLTSLVLYSCQKSEELLKPDPATLTEAPMVSATTGLSNSNLIYEENFEGTAVFGDYISKLQNSTSYGFTVVGSPVFEGAKSGRFELRDTDLEASGGTRTEVLFNPLVNPHRWYSFSTYFPSEFYKIDDSWEIITQFHQGGGTSPSISLMTRNDKLTLEIRSVPGQNVKYEIAPLVKDVWHTYVMNINHSNGSDGLIEIWQDGVKIFAKTGPNSYDFATYDRPKWKLGIYKWDWNGSGTTATKIRVLYFDNIRLGNENATYSNMVSSGSTTPPPTSNAAPTVSITSPANNATFSAPGNITINASATDADGTISSVAFYNGATLLGTDNSSPYSFVWSNVSAGNYSVTARATDNAAAVTTSSAVALTVGTPPASDPNAAITSFTLVSAETERDILTLTNGATYNLSQLGTQKLNIRANTSTTTFSNVTLQLTGAQSKTYVDPAAPYALHGDNGSGNYFYGNWNPPALGTYTLTATPMTGSVTHASSTISFTFTNGGTTPPPNSAPVVGAGSDATLTLPTNSVNLSGSATDAGGSITSTTWSKVSGPTQFAFSSTSSLATTVSNLAAGTYVFRLTATDNNGATASDDVNVTVNAAVSGGSTGAVSSFTLINAETETAIMTISNGATISFNQIGTHKLNIRANTSGTVDKVNFVLSGMQNVNSTDSAIPFALMGDNGSGNYYYGTWNPPALGTYNLRATPIVGTTNGTSNTISFTFVQ